MLPPLWQLGSVAGQAGINNLVAAYVFSRGQIGNDV